MSNSRPELVEVLPPEAEQALADALRSAWEPRAIDPRLNDLLIEQALEDPLAPPTDAEVIESERLRDALDKNGDHEDVRLARALAAALAPEASVPMGEQRAATLSARATRARRSKIVYVAFGIGAGLAALAAAVALVVGPLAGRKHAASAEPVLAVSRSTAPLFDEPFDPRRTSARVDRIAAVRARELRNNRYALWGVAP